MGSDQQVRKREVKSSNHKTTAKRTSNTAAKKQPEKRPAAKTSVKSERKTSPAKNTATKNGATNNRNVRTTSTKNTSRNSNSNSAISILEDPVTREILLVVVAALAILLMLCNFGFVGVFGKRVSAFLFGIFGFFQYILPIYIAFFVFFKVSNPGNHYATVKLVAGFVLIFVLGVFAELIAGYTKTATTYSLKELYEYSSFKRGGGVISGSLCYFLAHYLSKVGCIFLSLTTAIICIVIISEKSFLRLVKNGSKLAYEKTRQGVDYTKAQTLERRQVAQEKRIREREYEEQERILQTQRREDFVAFQNLKEPDEKALAERIRDDMHEIILNEEEPQTVKKKRATKVASEKEAMEEIQTAKATDSMNFIYSLKDSEDLHENDHFSKISSVENDMYEDPSDLQDMFRKDFMPKEEVETPFDVDGLTIEGMVSEDMKEVMADFNPALEMQEDDLLSAFDEGNDSMRDDFPAYSDHAYAHADSPYEVQSDQDWEKMTKKSSERQASGSYKNVSKNTYEEASKAVSNQGSVSKDKSLATASNEQIAPMNRKLEPIPYKKPYPELLEHQTKGQRGDSKDKLQETARRLQQTLANFGVHVTITNISQGPTVTRYELQPEQGVKVSKIVGLTDDIKLNLAATDIRMEAPIPGKAAIGIEVPNAQAVSVPFYELVKSQEFQNASSNISFAVGKDIAGKVVITDIAKMPHLLIAGATGSGKSVCINTIIMSILYKAHPDDVKLIMIDPKVVELSVYNGIPHLLIPVVTEAKKAAGALQWGVSEMTDRYQKFADMGVRDIKGYNAKIKELEAKGEENPPKKMPQLVIIVDELADLMMVAQGEVEEAICRLAQLARAAGIHLIIATQRPSVDVITGLIKANMPSRIAFSVSSGTDSRTILDQVGAEKLLGKGDMLFYPQGFTKPARIQGAFVSDDDVANVVDFLKNQAIGNVYDADIQEKIQTLKSSGTSTGGTESANGYDELFEQAARRIFEKEKASIGDLQRALKIGFNRAARIMDQLCEAGIVGEEEGTKPRKIIMTEDQFEQFVEDYL